MSQVQRAVDCFDSGFNCSQAILSTYCEDLGLDQDTALKIACGLGAGMGRQGETCGAVSGAYLLISLKHGQHRLEDTPAREQTYALIQEFARQFTERNATTVCRELLGVDLIGGDPETIAARVATVCPKVVRDAADIAEQLLGSD